MIEYFLTTSSPWAYLGHAEFGRIAKTHGVAIRCRPMPVRRVFDETGGLPLPKRHPVRQAYRLVELQRWRERRGLALDLKPAIPLGDPSLADRTAIAIGLAGGDPMPFLGAAMAGLWAGRLDLSAAETVAHLADGVGLDGTALVAAAQGEEAGAVYEENFSAALTAGVFGAPSYVRDGEVFWGQDRLDLLERAVVSGRPAYRPG
ncbi:2-hydroxychromene-2-carboxylate isomerase [Enterovirga rhinocerotis]|uniref:2-hydroxychromene-2-carboxylate isomerase n=1 Tax=Enterovirga rhinocerotis TaxID=1339210 RepID=A0A4R7C8G0_9HYPH|nr:2-hydroxychromene-2-carboxylate isomerase [Enterovirga rhinocerotis]TDR93595.1 2-hydroxychromene-2-carboxylate isomerase [Enterovirga rhinocerotis]